MLKDNERFEALPKEKQLRIIDACLDEFGEQGYQNASTNRIVKAAGIAKGLLFHYFENKKKLFLYILDYSIRHMMALMDKYMPLPSGEIFEILGHITMAKLQVALEEPRMYHILYDVYINFPPDIKKEALGKYDQLFMEYREQFMLMMDSTKLKDGVEAGTVVNLITDFLDGYYKRRLGYFKTLTPDQLLAEIDELQNDVMKHLDIIRRGVYKDEYLV